MQLRSRHHALRRQSSAMRTIILLLLACSLASSCLGKQIRIPMTRKDVPAGTHFRSLAALAEHAANDFSGPMHHAQQLYTDPSLTVPLHNFFNRMYVGSISIGTPSVTYSLVFDTGSADMWVFAAKSSKPTLSYVQYYDYTKSSTSAVTTTAWSIQYGKGASSGVLVSDTVSLAAKAVTGFTFAQATSFSSDFESSDMPLDGLLGLAFASVNSAGAPTLLDTLQSQGLITERVFSFYLTTDNPVGSEFVLGAPDLALTKGNMTYLDLASTSGMWLLSMQQVNVGSVSQSYCSSSDCAVLLDTGTSFIGMPTSSFNSFASLVTAVRPDCLIDSASGLIRCSSLTSTGLPSISFSLQGSLFTLQGSDYYDSGILGFMAIDVTTTGRANFWILGDTFLKTYYTVFDMDNQKIGIVGAVPGAPYTKPSTPTSPSVRWQVIALIIAAVVAVVIIILCIVRLRHRSNRRPPSPPAAPAPYMLQQAPAFHIQDYRTQPPPTVAIPPTAQSDFARDFYAAGQV